MTITLREAQLSDIEALQDLTEQAFEPVFISFQQLLGATIFDHLYPDWRKIQRDLVTTFYNDDNMQVWIATVAHTPAGLIVWHLNSDEKTGTVEFLVVHPDYQQQGIATRLNELALIEMRAAGMELAFVGTGGDESHAPARHAYEKMGYTALPQILYFKSLNDAD